MDDHDWELDPELEALVEEFQERGVPPWHSTSVESARRIEDEVFSSDGTPELPLVRTVEIDGPGGPLPLRIYRPDAENPPALVFYHGGGWTLGTLDSADDICRELAARGGCLVVSVDYRLAPEHPFPAAVDDALAALDWTATYADAFGGDPDRLGVAGTSAGGNLAAAVAMRVRTRGEDEGARGEDEGARAEDERLGDGVGDTDLDLDGQFLLYPITDHDFETESYCEYADSPVLSRTDMQWFWDNYLRSPVDAANPYASVLRADDLSGVAPATVLTAGVDVLRDEGRAYAEQLSDHGVETTHHDYPSLAHGFLSMTDDVAAADEAMGRLADQIGQRLGVA